MSSFCVFLGTVVEIKDGTDTFDFVVCDWRKEGTLQRPKEGEEKGMTLYLNLKVEEEDDGLDRERALTGT